MHWTRCETVPPRTSLNSSCPQLRTGMAPKWLKRVILFHRAPAMLSTAGLIVTGMIVSVMLWDNFIKKDLRSCGLHQTVVKDSSLRRCKDVAEILRMYHASSRATVFHTYPIVKCGKLLLLQSELRQRHDSSKMTSSSRSAAVRKYRSEARL